MAVEAKHQTLSTHRAMNTKIKFLIASVVVSLNLPALAAPCSSLSYDELQDMKVEELTKELCTARKVATENRSEAFDKVISRYAPDPAGADALSNEADKCENEQKRILRVLTKKNVETEKIDYAAVCKAPVKKP